MVGSMKNTYISKAVIAACMAPTLRVLCDLSGAVHQEVVLFVLAANILLIREQARASQGPSPLESWFSAGWSLVHVCIKSY